MSKACPFRPTTNTKNFYANDSSKQSSTTEITHFGDCIEDACMAWIPESNSCRRLEQNKTILHIRRTPKSITVSNDTPNKDESVVDEQTPAFGPCGVLVCAECSDYHTADSHPCSEWHEYYI